MKTLRPKILFKKNHKFPKIRQSCYVSGKNQRNSEPARKKLFGSSQTKISFFLIQQPPSAPPSLPHRPKNFACRENIKSPTKPLSGKKFHEHEYAYTDTLGTTNPRTGKGGLGRERGRERGGVLVYKRGSGWGRRGERWRSMLHIEIRFYRLVGEFLKFFGDFRVVLTH